MRFLLDTHILLALAKEISPGVDTRTESVVMAAANESVVSAASVWEIAIKAKLGKLHLVRPVDEFPAFFESLGLTLLDITHRHAVVHAQPEPPTRDPFDRMLLSQCVVENMRLVTHDHVLSPHPLAWRSP